jgi:outer membrane lipoprotein-sorting protein
MALLFLAGGAHAEESVFDHPVTDANRAAMQAVCARIAANPNVVGSFTQTKRITRLKKDFVSTGSYIFSGQLGVYWEVKKPFPSVTVMTADKLVQKTASGRSSVLDATGNATFKRFADTIQGVFAGRVAAMEKDFTLYYLPVGTGWRLGLVPKEATVKKVIAAMEIEGERFIARFRLSEGSGDTVSYQFADSRFVQELSADEKQLFLY